MLSTCLPPSELEVSLGKELSSTMYPSVPDALWVDKISKLHPAPHLAFLQEQSPHCPNYRDYY